MELYARQGDLIFKKTNITQELKPEKGVVLAGTDSTHTVLGDVLHAQDGRRHLIRLVDKTEVVHSSRHPAVTLEPGDYEVYPQRERGGEEDRAVED